MPILAFTRGLGYKFIMAILFLFLNRMHLLFICESAYSLFARFAID